jgi:hypothetical protein
MRCPGRAGNLECPRPPPFCPGPCGVVAGCPGLARIRFVSVPRQTPPGNGRNESKRIETHETNWFHWTNGTKLCRGMSPSLPLGPGPFGHNSGRWQRLSAVGGTIWPRFTGLGQMVGASNCSQRSRLRGAGDHLAKWPALLAKWSPACPEAWRGVDRALGGRRVAGERYGNPGTGRPPRTSLALYMAPPRPSPPLLPNGWLVSKMQCNTVTMPPPEPAREGVPAVLNAPRDGGLVSHAWIHTQTHTQALHAEQLKRCWRSVSHGPPETQNKSPSYAADV